MIFRPSALAGPLRPGRLVKLLSNSENEPEFRKGTAEERADRATVVVGSVLVVECQIPWQQLIAVDLVRAVA